MKEILIKILLLNTLSNNWSSYIKPFIIFWNSTHMMGNMILWQNQNYEKKKNLQEIKDIHSLAV